MLCVFNKAPTLISSKSSFESSENIKKKHELSIDLKCVKNQSTVTEIFEEFRIKKYRNRSKSLPRVVKRSGSVSGIHILNP